MPKGDYRGEQRKKDLRNSRRNSNLRAALNHSGAEITRPRNTVHKNQTPRKINRKSSRTHALSIVDRSRICFASYEQINSIDECT